MTNSSSSQSRMVAVSLDLQPLSLASFSMRHELDAEGIVVKLAGNADSDVTAAFAHHLERLHAGVVQAGFRHVTLDFRELYFLTSACVKCLVVAIKRTMALDARQQYRIRLVTSPSLRWQERSFEVLSQIAPMLVSMISEEELTKSQRP